MGSMGGEMYPFGDGYRLPRPDLTAERSGLLLTLTDEQRGGAAQARNRFTEDRDPRQHGHDPYAGPLGVFDPGPEADQRGSGADQREDQEVRRQRPVSLGQKTLGEHFEWCNRLTTRCCHAFSQILSKTEQLG